jgi:hypothetical protein
MNTLMHTSWSRYCVVISGRFLFATKIEHVSAFLAEVSC